MIMKSTFKFSPVLLSGVTAIALTAVLVTTSALAQTTPPPPGVATGSVATGEMVSPVPRPPDVEILGGSDDSVPSPVVAVGVPEVIPGTVPPPDAAILQSPTTIVVAPIAVAPVPDAIAGDSSVTKIPQPGADPTKPDVYYDSSLNVPTGPLSETVGPRKVDPIQEPASKLVIVRKNSSAISEDAQVIAAGRALELGRYESALEMYQDLLKKNDRDPRILMGLAVAQQKTGLKEQAILTYEKLLDIMPDNADATINLTGLIQEKYPEVAMRRLIDLGNKFPSNPGIAAQMGMIYAQAGDYAQAMTLLGKAASLDPHNAGHFYNMAIVADRMGSSKQQAINYYEQALEIDAVYGDGRSIPRATIYDRLSKLRRG